MKTRHLLLIASLSIIQAVCAGFGQLSAQTLSSDTLSWSWEVSTTVSTMTKTCTLEFSGDIVVDWGDSVVQTLSDTLSGTLLTHVYSSASNYHCTVFGTGITYFKADSRRILTLDPTKAPALTYLSLTSNQLVAIDLTKNTELVSLYCGSNDLPVLNVSKCAKLETLTCTDNNLLGLDVSKVPSLKKLTCHTNPMTSLQVCPTGSLTYISCLNCNFQVAALDSLFTQLPTLTSVSTSRNLYVLYNPGAANCNIQKAIAKNWSPDKVVTSSSFYMPVTTCTAGDSVQIDICLTNPVPVIAFELDVVFPEGFELDTLRSCLSLARKGNHLLSVSQTAHQQFKFLVYSMTTGDLFKNSSGVVLQLFGKAPDSVKVCTVELKKAVLVDTTTSMCPVILTNGSLTILSSSVNGDVNDDGLVDVTDIVNLVACIYGRIPTGFNAIAADLDNNGVLNVADITRMVALINASGAALRSEITELPSGRALVFYDKQSTLGSNNLYLRQSKTSENCLELCLDNTTQIQACQVDISLPEGITLQTTMVSGKTSRQNGHIIQVSQTGSNKYRLLAYALKPDADFKGDTGVLALLPLQVAESLPETNYPVCLDAPVLTGMNLTTLPSSCFDVLAKVGSVPLSENDLKAGTDGQSGLWVQGMGLTEVFVWNLSGQLLEHHRLNGTTTYHAFLPKGVYVVRARSDSKMEVTQKVLVR